MFNYPERALRVEMASFPTGVASPEAILVRRRVRSRVRLGPLIARRVAWGLLIVVVLVAVLGAIHTWVPPPAPVCRPVCFFGLPGS